MDAITAADEQVMLTWGLSHLDWLDLPAQIREHYRTLTEMAGK